MSWDITKDYMIGLIGILIATWQIVAEIKKENHRYKKLRIGILFGGILLLGGLTLNQIDRNSKEKRNYESKIESISSQLTTFQNQKEKDDAERKEQIAKDKEFQARLFNEFKIIRDSASNQPKNITTNIGKARDVYIQ